MALTKEIIEDKIEVVGKYKLVQVRTATVIKEDGVELSRSFHRHTVQPNDDITNESAEVQAICNAVHSQEIKDAYQAMLDEQAAQEVTPSEE